MKLPCIIGSVVIGVIVLFFLIALFAYILMKKTYINRGDGSVLIRYPLASELNNIEINKGYIKTKGNINLTYFTYKKKGTTPKALIMVIHGIGFGHSYLFPLINRFLEDGYMVFAYDQYASGTSEGKTFKTMTRGSVDIKYVLKFIESKSEFNKMPLYVFGHSWGGYVAGYSLKYSKRISKCVIVSGFDNEADFKRSASLFIHIRNIFVAGLNSFVRIRSILSKTTANVYYLQGNNDLVVNPRFAGKNYEKKFANKSNIAVEILENKGHTPFITNESQALQNELMSCFGMFTDKILPTDKKVDFREISKIDEDVYKKISSFYSK